MRLILLYLLALEGTRSPCHMRSLDQPGTRWKACSITLASHILMRLLRARPRSHRKQRIVDQCCFPRAVIILLLRRWVRSCRRVIRRDPMGRYRQVLWIQAADQCTETLQ